jgi:hypothetical protein
MKIKNLFPLGLVFLLFPSISWACITSPITLSFVWAFVISLLIFIVVAVISIASSIKGKRISLVRIIILVLAALLIIMTSSVAYEYYQEKIEGRRAMQKCEESGGDLCFMYLCE